MRPLGPESKNSFRQPALPASRKSCSACWRPRRNRIVGSWRSKYAYDAGEIILAPRHVEQWFRTDDLHLLVVAISDAALTAACDGGKADLRYGPKLVDARVGELITAVNAERIAGFPNGPLFLDSAEQELAAALIDRHRPHSPTSLECIPLSASSAEILADIPLGWLRTIAGTLAQSAAAF
jgi:hypothetical protein